MAIDHLQLNMAKVFGKIILLVDNFVELSVYSQQLNLNLTIYQM